ncbi:MAG: 3-methyl-2-oxobutanoate hydroxymethyltransferase [Acidobacteriaceae bacterium]
MSLTQLRSSVGTPPAPKVTTQTLLDRKIRGEAITALTAYDYPTARLVDEAGIDMILVGDSLGMAVLGYDDTLAVTVEEMLHHTRAVRRAVRTSFLVVDMPYGSYHVSEEEALRHAVHFVKEGGAEAVKIEGGTNRAALVDRLTRAEIPVVGHIGLTPQSLHRMGGYRVQGRSFAAVEMLRADALAIEAAGAVAIVLEGVPREVAGRITQELSIPTIGIGAGPDCDGQILVFHDLFHLSFSPAAKFVRRYGDGAELFRQGIASYREDVTTHAFPSDAESYHLPSAVREAMEAAERLETHEA